MNSQGHFKAIKAPDNLLELWLGRKTVDPMSAIRAHRYVVGHGRNSRYIREAGTLLRQEPAHITEKAGDTETNEAQGVGFPSKV